jgi:MerR family transcriptional regulator, light-induced transcriptional regulator
MMVQMPLCATKFPQRRHWRVKKLEAPALGRPCSRWRELISHKVTGSYILTIGTASLVPEAPKPARVNDRPSPTPPALSIAAVERDTGLSKDTLRAWERRYGFPTPERDALGERAYPLAQVDRLRIVRRLLDAGHRPGQVVPLELEALQALAAQAGCDAPGAADATLGGEQLSAQLALIRSHDVPRLRRELARLLSQHGLARFVTELIGPLNAAVGDAWLRGQLEIFEEHLYTETVQVLLRGAIAALPEPAAAGAPHVLLTTLPGEPHGLGLLMAESVLALEGCRCTSLGVQTPVWDIVLAARACACDIVALSFTGALNPNLIADAVAELRGKLPATVALWVGGSAPVLYRRPVPGVRAFASLADLPEALRRAQGASPN